MVKDNGKMLGDKAGRKKRDDGKNKYGFIDKSFVYKVQSGNISSLVRLDNLVKNFFCVDISLFFN